MKAESTGSEDVRIKKKELSVCKLYEIFASKGFLKKLTVASGIWTDRQLCTVCLNI